MAVTSRDVAARAGVSQATVSRVLNGNYPVSEQTRARVMEAMRATGFVLNAQAKAMRTSRSGSIGLVTSDIQNPYFPYLLDELTRAASDHGMNAVVWNDSSSSSQVARDGLASGAVDGLIYTAAREGMSGLWELVERGAPVLLCNRAPTDGPARVVMNDHEESGRRAAEYFLAQGRRRVAAIFGSPDTFATPLRQRGFLGVMRAAERPVPADLIRQGVTTYETGREGALSLLEAGHDFDALFCSSDVLAFGAIAALRSSGRLVPHDVGVMGIDGLRMSAWDAFDLTTVHQDVPQIAARAVSHLLAVLSDEPPQERLELVAPRLVERSSTA